MSKSDHQVTIAFQGLEESFTYLASRNFFRNYGKAVSFVSQRHAKGVFGSVVNGSAQYGVVALESSTHGSIRGVHDALLSLEGMLLIVGEVGQQEEHCLCGSHNTLDKPIELIVSEVFGHPHILECCNEYIDEIDSRRSARGLPDVVRVPTTDSVEACIIVAREKNAGATAIASAEAAHAHGLKVLMKGVGNDRNSEVLYKTSLFLCKQHSLYVTVLYIDTIYSGRKTWNYRYSQ